MSDPFDKVRRAAAHAGLPELEETTWYRTPSLAVRGRSFTRLKDDETLVVLCDPAEKDALMAAAPDLYYQTDHYRGYGAMLVRLGPIDIPALAARLTAAWRLKAPKRLLAAFDAAGADPATSQRGEP